MTSNRQDLPSIVPGDAFEPWWNYSRIEQAPARAIRTSSHAELSPQVIEPATPEPGDFDSHAEYIEALNTCKPTSHVRNHYFEDLPQMTMSEIRKPVVPNRDDYPTLAEYNAEMKRYQTAKNIYELAKKMVEIHTEI